MTEQRKKQLMIAGALVAVVALVLVFVAFRSRGGEEVTPPTEIATSPGPMAVGGAALPSAGGGTGAAAPGPGAMPGAGVASATDIGIMKPPPNAKPRVAPRKDPFQPFPLPPEWLEVIRRMNQAAQPPLIYQLGLPAVAVRTTYVSGPSTATPGLPYAVAAGSRRMSGILWDGRVWAIIETDDGQSHVVKPGDVLDDGSRVTAISRDSMVVAQAGQRQTVGMKGKPAPAAAPAGGVAPTGVFTPTTGVAPPVQGGWVSPGASWGPSREGE
jgi:hypothetical protein